MVSKRTEKRKRQRKRRRKTIYSIILVLFLSAIIFTIYEYWSANNEAKKEAEEIIDSEQQEENIDNFQPEEPLDDTINVLLLGEDSDKYGNSRTDTIMIGQYDPEYDRAKLVSIMRDTFVKIPDHGYNKINASYAIGGPELLRKTIKENFDIDIHYFAYVNFRGFERIVDTIAPDGVEINVEKRMYYYDEAGDVNINLQPGVQKLDGETLLDYARFRNDYESDFGRVRRQQQVMSALKDEMLSFTSIPKLPSAIGTIEPFITTNMGIPQITKFATDFLMNTPDEIETMRIPIEGSYRNKNYEHAGAVLEINLQENVEAFKEFFENQPKEDDETREVNESDTENETNNQTNQS
ncbi:LCP family protein [Tenuibacillus multivorans]|uniref:Regulatory protein MsrR n=1 Tax=Tenuibacillus multivorans TaxID=237069 RepID=A0A1G9ZWF5_9BACI|nr:LCP family protein [Tenuibacillus multivorans]GEL76888.1 transcriptional regulator [Tenuibacillus multivorans]SDN25982.1 cell envelope-related function transcriptional attenuator common domain-containing protein [Tenuibacillus multivorans]